MIIGQYFGKTQRSQQNHRPTVGQAVALVGPSLARGGKGSGPAAHGHSRLAVVLRSTAAARRASSYSSSATMPKPTSVFRTDSRVMGSASSVTRCRTKRLNGACLAMFVDYVRAGRWRPIKAAGFKKPA